MKTINGNLIDLALKEHIDVIVHGCNCFNTMVSGFARVVRDNFPLAYKADQATTFGDKGKLGTIEVIDCDGIDVVNCYTQYNYGMDRRYVDYDALRSCLRSVHLHYANTTKAIGMPLIGAGLGGGEPTIILQIMEDEIPEATVVLLPKR